MMKFVIFFFLTASVCLASGYDQYFDDTYQCLEAMRNRDTGLISDSVTADLNTLQDATSPSNIALDILVQLEAGKLGKKPDKARQNIELLLETLAAIPFHQESGLFFNRYSTDGKVKDWYVSSIDNLHLAYALWTIAHVGKGKNKNLALKLYQRMDFHYLYDMGSGLFYGGAYRDGLTWKLEQWRYDHWGSEGRSLYVFGYGIGLIKDPLFLHKFQSSMTVETNDQFLMLWDGGAFQLLLPELLLTESRYSNLMKNYFRAYADQALEQGRLRNYPVPANHSASQVNLRDYNGKAGSPEYVSRFNRDFLDPDLSQKWDVVFTPHAAFLAATVDPQNYLAALIPAEGQGKNRKLYVRGLGWLDAFHVKGKFKGEVVPVFLSFDQAIIALSAAKILSSEKELISSRALSQHRGFRHKVETLYRSLQFRVFNKASSSGF